MNDKKESVYWYSLRKGKKSYVIKHAKSVKPAFPLQLKYNYFYCSVQ